MTLGLFPAVALAIGAEPIRRELFAGSSGRLRAAGALLWLGLALPAVATLVRQLHDTQAVQRDSLEFVHRNFGGQVGFHPEAAMFCGPTPPLGNWFSYTIYRHFAGDQREAEVARFEKTFNEGARALSGRFVPARPVPARAARVLGRELPAVPRVGLRRGAAAARSARRRGALRADRAGELSLDPGRRARGDPRRRPAARARAR